jgi:hypothetical protein
MTPTQKLFTPASATRTLPLVRKIVADLLAAGRELKALNAEGRTEKLHSAETERLVRRIREHQAELAQVGCEFKDWNFDAGLVDFPAIIDGRSVLLCWRSDEPAITHYHGTNEGFAARKEIPAELLK